MKYEFGKWLMECDFRRYEQLISSCISNYSNSLDLRSWLIISKK